MRKITTALVSVLLSNSVLANDPRPADVDLFCSGMLLRASGLIQQNIGRFGGEARGQLTQVSNHLENNGNILMQRGMMAGGSADSLNAGGSFANQEIGSNVLAILQKGSNQNKSVMGCLRRGQ
jgi:hypothetical protein